MLAHGCMTDTFLFSNERLCQTLESNRPFLSAEPLKDSLPPSKLSECCALAGASSG